MVVFPFASHGGKAVSSLRLEAMGIFGRVGPRCLNVVAFEHPACGGRSIVEEIGPAGVVLLKKGLVRYEMHFQVVDVVDEQVISPAVCQSDGFVFMYSECSNASAVAIGDFVERLIDAKGTIMFPMLFVHIAMPDAKRRKVPTTFGEALAMRLGGEFISIEIKETASKDDLQVAQTLLGRSILLQMCDQRDVEKAIRGRILSQIDNVTEWDSAALSRYELMNTVILLLVCVASILLFLRFVLP